MLIVNTCTCMAWKTKQTVSCPLSNLPLYPNSICLFCPLYQKFDSTAPNLCTIHELLKLRRDIRHLVGNHCNYILFPLDQNQTELCTILGIYGENYVSGSFISVNSLQMVSRWISEKSMKLSLTLTFVLKNMSLN